jgi:hypothetical protein
VVIAELVIIHVRMAVSRTRRGANALRPMAAIQGGMTRRLMGPHSRLKERHEERREGARGPEVEGGRGTAQLVCSANFHVS